MSPPPTLRSFLDELRRRRVYRVGALYVTGAYVVLEVADLVLPALGAPDAVLSFLLVGAAVGFPVALALAWAYDVGPEGVKADEGGSLADFLGGRRALRLLVAAAVSATSLGLGWAGWFLWLRAPASEPPGGPQGPGPDAARVAVLYFDDHSPGGELGYLADGLTEGLIHELSQVDRLEVVSRNGVKRFRERPVSTDSLVAYLGAGSIVEGSVTGSTESVRLTVQLVDGATDTHLASLSFERDRDDLFTLQQELAREVADALRSRLGEEIGLREARRGTESQGAWTRVLQADRLREDYAELRLEDAEAGRRLLDQADALLSEAQELDGSWSTPPQRRAVLRYLMALLEGDVAGRVEPSLAREGIEYARGALERDPESGAAHHILGRLLHALSYRASPEEVAPLRAGAGEALQRAVELDPAGAAAWVDLSEWFLDEGRFPEAMRAAARAQEADAFLELPHDVLHAYYYAGVQQGPIDEARAACDEGHARFPRSSLFVTCQLFLLASFPQIAPRVARAWILRDSLVDVTSESRAEDMRTYGTLFVAKVAARAGLPDSATSILRRALGEPIPDHLLYDTAHFWVLMGRADSAVALLDRHLDVYPADSAAIAQDWWFDPLHGRPSFRALVGLDG